MNPKDMTNSDLLVELVNRTKGYGFLNDPKPVISELLRRLGEADALRNNESQILAERDGAVFIASNIAAKADALRKENEELRDALIDARSWMDAGMFEDVPPQYTAMVAKVDAMLSKGSEASHE